MKRGDIVQLGRHRLMCGDCTELDDVQKLFADEKADLVFTSPPYLNKRTYLSNHNESVCWDAMMCNWINHAPTVEDAPVLVNLGTIYRNGSFYPFWQTWIDTMISLGWKHYALDIWDKKVAMIGAFGGRLRPRYDFIFHLTKKPRRSKKTEPTIPSKYGFHSPQLRARNGSNASKLSWHGQPYPQMRSHDNIVAVGLDCTKTLKHPARFPPALPLQFLRFYSSPDTISYDPFCGCGSSIIASQMFGNLCFGMEIEPEYCDMTIERYHKHIEKVNAPSKPKRRVIT